MRILGVLLLLLAWTLPAAAQITGKYDTFQAASQACPGGPALCAAVPPIVFVGPGDVQTTGWSGWWGLRAFSAAKVGTKAAQLCLHSTPATCQDINSLANGKFDTASAATFCSSACDVATLYDQSGNGLDATQATAANRPAYTPNCLGTLPCMTVAGGSQGLATGNHNGGPPVTMVGMASNTSNTGFGQNVIADGGNGNQLNYHAATTHIEMDCLTGGAVATVTGSAFHAMEGVCAAGTNGIVLVVDSAVSTATGTVTATGANPIDVTQGNGNGGFSLVGSFTEGGFLAGTALTSTVMQSIDANVHSFWGF